MSSTPLLQTYCSHHSLLMDLGSIIIILVPLGPLFHKCSCFTEHIMWLGFRPRSVNFVMLKCLFFSYSVLFFFANFLSKNKCRIMKSKWKNNNFFVPMSVQVESLRNAGLELLQPLWHYLCVLGKMQSRRPR